MNTALILLCSIAGALVLGGASALIAWRIRLRRFRPTADKALQQTRLNEVLEPFGFAYDRQSDAFYSLMDAWQRDVGYCRLYDEAAPALSMILDSEPVTFSYGGRRWLIELWKGQYGLSVGGEIGIYNTDRADMHTEQVTGVFYDCVPDEQRLPLSFVLRREDRVLLQRRDTHWWLTGFVLGEFAPPDTLVMDALLTFPERGMCEAFLGGLQAIGYRPDEYTVLGTSVQLKFSAPHTAQPVSRRLAEGVVQRLNEENCKLFERVTAPYDDTLDKLEYIRAAVPDLYAFFLRSLHSREQFEAFRWLWDRARPTGEQPPQIKE